MLVILSRSLSQGPEITFITVFDYINTYFYVVAYSQIIGPERICQATINALILLGFYQVQLHPKQSLRVLRYLLQVVRLHF